MPDFVLHVTGARPNFPKAAPVLEALRTLGVRQQLVHTGQHYDDSMSAIFFRDLGLPAPDINLGVGSGSHAYQTAQIMISFERLVLENRPDLVVVYGDINSTVAAALVAAKLGIRCAHVEAGLRSFDWTMPEEVNRVVTDRLCQLLFATSPDAVAHLGNEGIPAQRIHLVGNPMIDTLLRLRDKFDNSFVESVLAPGVPYAVGTFHRPVNVDDDDAVSRLVKAVHEVADQVDILIPVHPRGREALAAAGLFEHPHVHATEPLGYLSFLGLVAGSALVVTDSGGVQEETTVLGVPCLTLRPNTERPITITDGTNLLVTVDTLPEAAGAALAAGRPATWRIPPLWDGEAGPRIASVIASCLAQGS